MHFSSLLLIALATLIAALPSQSKHVLHEKRDGPMRNWVKRSRVSGASTIPVRIGLTQQNLHRADDLIMQVSNPSSSQFGQYYTPEQVHELFAPSASTINAVMHWLESMGIGNVTHTENKQWLAFDTTVADAEQLFQTQYHAYEHVDTGKMSIACDEYHLPSHLTQHIDFIKPGIKLMHGKTSRTTLDKRGFKTKGQSTFSPPVLNPIVPEIINGSTEAMLANCDKYITPPCIATMYNISKATKHAAGNELGIFEEGDYYAAEDLALYFATFSPNIPLLTEPILEGIDGGFAPGLYAGGESDLDFTISYPIIYPQNSVLFQTDDFYYATGLEGGGGFLNTFLDAIDGSYCTYSAYGETGDASIDPVYPDPNILGYEGKLQCGVYKPTNVISISYGEQEDDLPTNYQQRQCSEFMKLGLQGVSVVIASGDSGVAARSTDDGNADGCLGTGQVFNPDFPASCPYVTALGATYLPPGANPVGDNEVAVSRFPSGGGFSNIYPQPSYQAARLGHYFSAHDPPYPSYNISGTNNPTPAQYGNGIYNKGGRGYPDASALGDNFVLFVNGLPELIGGTSAAAPLFAAILNRINEERLAVGKKTVGFVNPTLYSNPQVLHDITSGTNAGCNTNGFSAVEGWDPVTGLGTPNYQAMLELYMSLP